MNKELEMEALELIYKIAISAKDRCDEPIPKIITIALEEIISLARYKGVHGNLISTESKILFDLNAKIHGD